MYENEWPTLMGDSPESIRSCASPERSWGIGERIALAMADRAVDGTIQAEVAAIGHLFKRRVALVSEMVSNVDAGNCVAALALASQESEVSSQIIKSLMNVIMKLVERLPKQEPRRNTCIKKWLLKTHPFRDTLTTN